MMKTTEKGIVYKTSRISYISNYVLVILVVILFYLTYSTFNLTFTLIATNVNELISVFVVFGFLILITFLLEQPTIEQILRQYMITKTDIIKVEGLIRKKKTFIPFSNISGVTYKKGVIGRIFNFGDIELTGFKEGIVIKGVANPEEAYRILKHRIGLVVRPPALQKTQR